MGVLFCLGCQHGHHEIPKDPLFVSRKPVETKAELKPPALVAYAEPAMPADPAVALAKRTPAKNVPGTLTGNPSFAKPLPTGPVLLPPSQ